VAAKKPWRTAAVVAVALPLVAFGVYLANGTPRAVDPRLAGGGGNAQPDEKQIVAMVDTLAKKVRERPDDVQGVALLARSMGVLGRFKESAEAYAHLNALVPNDPQVLADYADALGMAQGRTLVGRPYELAKQALAIEPKHKKALALAGTAALDEGDYGNALRHYQTLGAELPKESEDASQVRAIVAEVMMKAAAAGQVLGTPPPKPAPAPAAQSKSVSGSVSVAPAIAAKIGDADTLFIFARAENGPRMPLAILRGSAKQLPMTFSLDDTHAMAPGMNLSSASAVRIEARISRSGNAMPQPGDLVGTSAVVQPGARDVKILVDRVLP
jgi:cytochrome c-type biogenesis protein CcmH